MATADDENSVTNPPGPPAEPTVPVSLAQKILETLQRTITSGSANPAEGKITTDEKSRYLAELAAYKCLNDHADQISNQIELLNLRNARILMVDSLDMIGDDLLLQQMLAEFLSWKDKLDEQRNGVERLIPSLIESAATDTKVESATVAGPAVIASLLGLLPGIVSLFRSDLELKGHLVTAPSRTALQARVAHGVRSAAVLLPNLRQVTDCTLLTRLKEAEESRSQLSHILSRFNVEVIEPQMERIATTELAISELPEDQSAEKASLEIQLNQFRASLKTSEQRLAVSKAMLVAYDEFRKQANSIPEGGKPSLLQLACRRSVLVDSHVTHLLYVEPVSMGGIEAISKTLWNFGRPSLQYVGGCVASFFLATLDGQVVATDTIVGTSQMDFAIKRWCRRLRRIL